MSGRAWWLSAAALLLLLAVVALGGAVTLLDPKRLQAADRRGRGTGDGTDPELGRSIAHQPLAVADD